MSVWHITGGHRLNGSIKVQGSKNAALPIIAASVIYPCVTELENVPHLSDIDTSVSILKVLGCSAEMSGNTLTVNSHGLNGWSVPAELMRKMRSSILFLGALVAGTGHAELSLPGGCRLGSRPIDIHISALTQMGIKIEQKGNSLNCSADRIVNTRIELPYPSVGATENIMLAACGGEGECTIVNPAKEPEIIALQEHLKRMGVNVSGAGTDLIRLVPSDRNSFVNTSVMPDRIAASTLMCAAAACGGEIELKDINNSDISSLSHFLKLSGCDIIDKNGALCLRSDSRLLSCGLIKTGPYPDFPTDCQPLIMAAMLKSNGLSCIEENVFDCRFHHVEDMRRLGADISVIDRRAYIRGVNTLHGAELIAHDLRGGAALVISALCAEGSSSVIDNGYIQRGYERLDKELMSLGAEIRIT